MLVSKGNENFTSPEKDTSLWHSSEQGKKPGNIEAEKKTLSDLVKHSLEYQFSARAG